MPGEASRIRVLDDTLVDQIAAGEVVERPSSVVKELLENALDAGANTVHVSVTGGGQELIRVVDDGCGMSPEDARLSILRHATSKLREKDDLLHLQTLGFRGEALPSIASIAHLRILTRPAAGLGGTEIVVEGGKLVSEGPAGCAPGTTVEVRDLFYNVPARRKFLKAKTTENGHVSGICSRVALVHPTLRLTLERDGRLVREFLPVATFKERVAELFPGERLAAYEIQKDGLQVSAVLAPPERARSGATGLHLFVNGRPVRDLALARAVAFAYGSVIPPGRFPLGAIDLRLPPEEVDVNVHPQKSEVRFVDARGRFDALTRALSAQLGTTAYRGPAARSASYWEERLAPGPRIAELAASFGGPAEPGPSAQPLAAAGWASSSGPALVPGDPLPAVPQAPVHGEPPARGPTPGMPPADGSSQLALGASVTVPGPLARGSETVERGGFFASLRMVGQVHRMLLVCEGSDGVYFIDQHAADERVHYDRLRRAYAAGTVKTQRLLFPVRVECDESELDCLQRASAEVERTGLHFRALGPTTIAIESVPALLQRAAPEQLLRDLLAELHGHGDRAFGDAVDMALATMACHAAIRAGDTLSLQEGQALLRSLDTVDHFHGHCPHGRPVTHHLPFVDLERKLGR